MKRLIIFLSILVFPAVSLAGNPLLSGDDSNAMEWKEKMEKFRKPQFITGVGRYPKPFHSQNTYKYPVKDVCTACHTYASHKKDKKYSPFYNAHSTYISCNTCHFAKGKMVYKWADIENGRVKEDEGKDFYGREYVKLEDAVVLSGENSVSKITAFLDGAPVEIPLEGNEHLLKDIKSIAVMHNVLTDKPFVCDDCHKPGGKLDFRALGFSEERIYDLEHNEILEGLKKYETLHFPNFIWKR